VTISLDRLCGGEISFSDVASDIARVMAERKSPTIEPTYYFESGLDYILNHFQGDLWPRTISTKATRGAQIVVRTKEEALKRFEQADFLDCKINAYPKRIEWKGINLQAPNFIFIDLDLGRFKSRLALNRCLDKTLKNISEKFNVAVNTTVLWSGNGYHIYLPVEAFVLEQESEFARFGNPSRKFIQFAEPYLSNNKSDPEHTKGLSFKNCMLRVPGSINSKHEGRKEVKIIQKWDGKRPSIKPLFYRFDLYLLIRRSKELHRPESAKFVMFSTDWKVK
jgi:hypothetical protein